MEVRVIKFLSVVVFLQEVSREPVDKKITPAFAASFFSIFFSTSELVSFLFSFQLDFSHFAKISKADSTNLNFHILKKLKLKCACNTVFSERFFLRKTHFVKKNICERLVEEAFLKKENIFMRDLLKRHL